MTLDEFKEKLFKKANMFSVSLNYSGTTYKVGYYTPEDDEVSVDVEYFHEKKEPYCFWFKIYRNKNWEIEQINLEPFYYIENLKAVQRFLDKVEKYGYLDS